MENIQIDYKTLALALLAANGNGSAANMLTMKDTLPSATFGNIHATGGIFTGPYERRVYNTQPVPKMGLLGRLRTRPTTTESPLHMILTNQAANAGTQPAAGSCAPCKVPGALGKAVFSFVWGQLCFSTEKVDVSNTLLGAIKNRGDFRDFQLIGDPFANNGTVPNTPAPSGNPLNSELQSMMLRFKVGWLKEYGKLLWNGNPANNSGRYKEFKGLDLLINTGYVDAEIGGAITAADSYIQTFSGTLGTNADLDNTVVQKLTNFYRKLQNRADVRGLTMTGAFVMTTQMFYELTALWACAYMTNRCSPTTGTANNIVSVTVDAGDQIAMRDNMRNGNYLMIDGTQVEVILDDSITEVALTAGDAGKFATSIRWIPLTVNGVESTYTEYFDYSNPFTQEIVRAMAQSATSIVTEGGRTLWVRRQDGYCVSMDATEAPRVILETPWLAGRLVDIKYTPTITIETGY